MLQEIPAVKLVRIFELEANLKWVLLIRNVKDGRDLLAGIVFMETFTQRQDPTTIACLHFSTSLSEAAVALIETHHKGVVVIGPGFEKMSGC